MSCTRVLVLSVLLMLMVAWRRSAAGANPLSTPQNPIHRRRSAREDILLSGSDAHELLAAGRKEAALAAFERVVESNPANSSHLIQLARLVAEVRENKTEAFELFHAAACVDPESPAALCNLGFVLESWVGETQAAEQLYRRALSFEPSNIATLNNLASLVETEIDKSMTQDGDERDARIREARELYKRALSANPNHVPTICNYAGLIQERGPEESEAATLFARALKLEPQNAEVLVNYGVLMEDWAQNKELAKKLYTKAMALRPSFTPASTRLGRVLRVQGALEDARGVLKKAFYLCPKDEDVVRELWRVRETQREALSKQKAQEASRGGSGHPKVVRCGDEELEDLEGIE